jgi:dienelactone hydrolase
VESWRAHRRAWDRFGELSDPPIERVAIPYEGTALAGYVLRPREAGRRPALILNNGSDGPVHAMWVQGGAAAVARGYVAIAFDGPGQGEALLEQGLPFRPGWEAVITPVIDLLVARDDVDPGRIALQGISGAVRRTLAYRMRPYGTDDPYEAFRAVREYHLRDVAGRIECPVLITDPDDEQFWPGQSEQLRDALNGPSTLVRFTAEEGANWHCEPMTPGLRDQRVIDRLDETLGLASP